VFGPQKEDSLILRKVSDIWFRTAVKFLTVVFFIFGALQSRPAGTKRHLFRTRLAFIWLFKARLCPKTATILATVVVGITSQKNEDEALHVDFS